MISLQSLAWLLAKPFNKVSLVLTLGKIKNTFKLLYTGLVLYTDGYYKTVSQDTKKPMKSKLYLCIFKPQQDLFILTLSKTSENFFHYF